MKAKISGAVEFGSIIGEMGASGLIFRPARSQEAPQRAVELEDTVSTNRNSLVNDGFYSGEMTNSSYRVNQPRVGQDTPLDWRYGKSLDIPDLEYVPNNILFKEGAVKHSNVGDFPKPGNPKKNPYPSTMLGGGHGQANIDYLEKIGMKYNVEHTYSNGVRIGNVPQHKLKGKRRGFGQSWFPEKWTQKDIKAAGEYIANTTKNFDNVSNGVAVYGTYNNVRVGVIKTSGQPATVFPDGSKQPSFTIKGFWEVIPKK